MSGWFGGGGGEVAEPSCGEEGAASSLDALTAKFPSAHPTEVARFAAARPAADEAVALYTNYRAWRDGDGAPAALEKAAAAVSGDGREKLITVGGRTAGGDRVVLFVGARYDTEVAVEAYAAYVCAKLDSLLAEDDAEKLFVLVDCRPQPGWRNPSVLGHIPLMRALATHVPNMYPERLRRIVVYPLPGWFTYMLGTITALLSADTRAKLCFLAGDEALGSPVPAELADHVTRAMLPEEAAPLHEGLP